MYAKFVDSGVMMDHGIQYDETDRLERAILTSAACDLMSANPELSPEDAVGDVLQVYCDVATELQKLKKRHLD